MQLKESKDEMMSHEDDLARVKEAGRALEYVKEQTPAICLAAVQQNGYALQYVKEQTPDICLAAVQQNGLALQYIKNQTIDKVDQANPAHKPFYDLGWRDGDLTRIYHAAIDEKAIALAYVKNQTTELCMKALRKNAIEIEYVKDLHSIADLVTDDIIQQGLEQGYNKTHELYALIKKIQDSNRISKEINERICEKINDSNLNGHQSIKTSKRIKI